MSKLDYFNTPIEPGNTILVPVHSDLKEYKVLKITPNSIAVAAYKIKWTFIDGKWQTEQIPVVKYLKNWVNFINITNMQKND
jgi:hypothetical protein